MFGTVAIPIADIPLKGAKQGNGDIILSLDGDVSDHQGVTLHVSIKQVVSACTYGITKRTQITVVDFNCFKSCAHSEIKSP